MLSFYVYSQWELVTIYEGRSESNASNFIAAGAECNMQMLVVW